MAFSTAELGAMLNILTKHSDWNELSKEIRYDVYNLNQKIIAEMTFAVSYDLECG
jgi:hypothetical protein